MRPGRIIAAMFGSRMAPVLLLLCALALGVGLLVEYRRGGPEPTLRAYLDDLGGQRPDAARAALAPEQREAWRDFVEFQQFNRYRVVSLSVRSPSLLAATLRGLPWRATEATLVVDVTEPSGLTWRGSTIVPVEWRDGRWLLSRPPFAPVR